MPHGRVYLIGAGPGDIELLTLKLRLFVSSAETAREMGLDWWFRDPFFGGKQDGDDGDEVRALRDRVAELEDLVRRAGLDGDSPHRALPREGRS